MHFTYMRTAAPGASRGYSYGGTAYVNPDAVTQIANGLSTTTFAYDNNGNVTQKTVDGTTTTYVYDYANRLTALGAGGATTTIYSRVKEWRSEPNELFQPKSRRNVIIRVWSDSAIF